MKRTAIFFFLFLLSLATLARDRKVSVSGRTLDNLTGENLGDVTLVLMTEDSIPLDTTVSLSAPDQPFAMGLFDFSVSREGRYIIRARAVGYDDAYVSFRLQSMRQFVIKVGNIRMNKTIRQLPEVQVRATKIKMVYSGDTIIYNAEAFKTAEGSMLDELIRILPGAAISSDGQISVNGHAVETLLVNGRDFFGGNAKVALQNLPAYTVSKIKVYDRNGMASNMTGKNMNDQVYTMDVRLKKEYSHGFIGNVEAGSGTDSRYRLRGFGMDMNDPTRAIVFGNMNNINEVSTNNTTGEWKPEDAGDGTTTTKTAGVDLSKFLDDHLSYADLNVTYQHQNNNLETNRNQQTFLKGGDKMEQTDSRAAQSTDNLKAGGIFRLNRKTISSDNYLDFFYRRATPLSSLDGTTLGGNRLLNTLTNRTQGRSNALTIGLKSNDYISMVADLIRLNGHLTYNRQTDRTFSLYSLDYADGGATDERRHHYADFHARDVDLGAHASYDYNGYGMMLSPYYDFSYRHSRTDNLFYRLDRLQGADTLALGMLPSSADALLSVLDAANSYCYRESQWQHTAGLCFSKGFKNGETTVTLPLRFQRASLNAWRTTRQHVSRSRCFLEPTATLKWSAGGREVSAEVKGYSLMPDLTRMIDFSDDSNPLYIVRGNKGLRDSHILQAAASYRWNISDQKLFNVSVQWSHTDNAVATALHIDQRTGVTTATPQNVNGNWTCGMKTEYTTPLDKQKHWVLSASVNPSFAHSVDLATTTDTPMSSTVNNFMLGGQEKVDWNPSEHAQLSLSAAGRWNPITGSRAGFQTINAADFHVGLNTMFNVPTFFCAGQKLYQFSTSLTAYCHRGYQASEMNTTEWIWNAQLSKSLLQGRLLLKLQGLDLLGQYKRRRFVLDAQGRTETTTNGLGRYAMFTIAWNLIKTPKRK